MYSIYFFKSIKVHMTSDQKGFAYPAKVFVFGKMYYSVGGHQFVCECFVFATHLFMINAIG